MNKLANRSLRKCLTTAMVFGLTAMCGVLGGPIAWAQDSFTVDWVESEGELQEISLSDSTVVISGFEYRVVPHARVRVRGNDSSLAGLRVGMKVQFMFETFEGLKAQVAGVAEGFVIHELQQLPDNVEILLH